VVSSGNAARRSPPTRRAPGFLSDLRVRARVGAEAPAHAATTANLIIYKGVYDDLITIWDRLVEEHLFFDCGASRNAYKQEGKKTLAYEIASRRAGPRRRRRGPVAVGETFIAAARGFREMREAGWIERVPLMVAAQATRANAVARAFREGTASRRSRSATRSRRGWRPAIRARRAHGFYGYSARTRASPATPRTMRSSGCSTGSRASRESGPGHRRRNAGRPRSSPRGQAARSGAGFCAIISETGLKTEAEPPSRVGVAFDYDSLKRLVAERLA